MMIVAAQKQKRDPPPTYNHIIGPMKSNARMLKRTAQRLDGPSRS